MRRRALATFDLKEVTMSMSAVLPVSRLICFGGAKACTNALVLAANPEDVIGLGFND